MPFEEDIEPELERRERRWNALTTVLPAGIASYFVDREWIDETRRRRESAQSAFESAREAVAEARDDIRERAEAGANASDDRTAEATVRALRAELDRARDALDSFRDIDEEYLTARELEEAASLREDVEEAASWVEAYETVGSAVEALAADLSALADELDPYRGREQYMVRSDRRRFEGTLAEIDARLSDGFDAAGASPLGARYIDRLEELAQKRGKIASFVEEYNDRYVYEEIRRHESMFTDIDEEGHDLSDEQKRAVVHDDKYNLVVAGAGSGKTVTLAHRIAYLTRREDRVLPDDILAITYTRNAANVMSTRLREKFGITDVHTDTFHGLGKKIIEEETGRRPEVFGERDVRNFVERTIRRETERSTGTFKENYFQFLTHFYDDFGGDADFEAKEATVEDRESHLTLKQESVRSRSEKRIADFLFLHQVEYEYRSLQDWVEDAPGEGQYRANFYLPEYDVVIEHRPVTADGDVPSWGEAADLAGLRTAVEWERSRFESDPDHELVETYEFEAAVDDGGEDGRLERALLDRLSAVGVPLDRMSYEEFVESAFDYGEYKHRIFGLFVSFIANARQLNLDPDEVDDRVPEGPPKAKAFTECAASLYRSYCVHLAENEYIDYADMIYRAIELMRRNPERYRNRYDQIVVDEFQDISASEVALLRCLVTPENDTKLFCVGDDWQSIYSFSGSDVTFFIDFEDHFDEPHVSELTANYRCPAAVVEAGNDLIENNDRQLEKEVRPLSGRDTTPMVHDLTASPSDGWYVSDMVSRVADLVVEYVEEEGADPGDVMVLARSKTFYDDLEDACEERDIDATTDPESKADPDEWVKLYSVHKAKGDEAPHVIIMHAVEDVVGFPSQVEDNELLDPVRIEPEGVDDEESQEDAEERRLFYVALTRSEETLDIVSSSGNRSRFVDEIDHHLTPARDTQALGAAGDRIALTGVEIADLWDPHESMAQTGLIADDAGKCRFVVWKDGDGETLDENRRYDLVNLRVNEYDGSYQVVIDGQTEVRPAQPASADD